MRLVIRRDQANDQFDQASVTGIPSEHKGKRYSLYVKVEITGEERALLDRYQAGGEVIVNFIATKSSATESSLEFAPVVIRINGLVNGQNMELNDLSAMCELETAIRHGCNTLKLLLSLLSTFGGEEIVEI